MKILKNIVLERSGKKPILLDIFNSTTEKECPIVVFCHGYKGFKDWGAWNLMATHFANTGYCFIKFNFSHNGGTIKNPFLRFLNDIMPASTGSSITFCLCNI